MKPRKLHPALLAGLFIGVVSALPIVSVLNSCCCLWLVIGGVLAAYVMQQNHPEAISLLDGAAVGLFAGILGLIVLVVVSQLLAVLHVAGAGGGFQGLSAPADSGVSPEVTEMLRRMDPRVLAIIGGAMFAVVGLVASTVGGAIGAALFRRSSTPPPADLPPGWGPPSSGWAPVPAVPPVPPPPPDIVADEPTPGPPDSNRSGPGDASS